MCLFSMMTGGGFVKGILLSTGAPQGEGGGGEAEKGGGQQRGQPLEGKKAKFLLKVDFKRELSDVEFTKKFKSGRRFK